MEDIKKVNDDERVMLVGEFVKMTVELAERLGLGPFDNDGRVHMKHIVALCKGYAEGYIGDDELNKAIGCLTIRSYIPIFDKSTIVMEIITSILNSTMSGSVPEFYIARLEKDKFFKVLMRYYACIESDGEEYETYDNYDLIYPILNEKLMKYCSIDYDKICGMINDCIDIYNLRDLLNSISGIDVESLVKATEDNREMIQKLVEDKDMVRDLKDILIHNDPGMHSFVESIEEGAREDAKATGQVKKRKPRKSKATNETKVIKENK